ncbi:MAG TPA: hypothetical protein VFH68_20875 [Polyangia bacterium]|nr:hypothetical protein [Polyangia bacterium]
MRVTLRMLLLAPAALVPACKPDLGAPISLIEGPRILAVRGNPPEAKEGVSVTYDLLAVDTTGTIAEPPASWAVCKLPRPPAETNSVSVACLGIADEAGPSPTFSAPITAADPNDQTTTGACSIFGPLRPPLDPLARPRDPDVTGGFYQPVRATLPGPDGSPIRAFDLQRIQCRLGSAPIDIAGQFNNRYDPSTNPNGYPPNQNPLLAEVTLAAPGGTPDPLMAVVSGQPAPPPASVAAGQRVTLEASWSAEAAETFPVYDIRTVTLTPQREALRVSWFATAGVFDHDVTGRDADDPGLSAANDWVAPGVAGPVHLWLVLRDSRGGVDFAEFALEVAP